MVSKSLVASAIVSCFFLSNANATGSNNRGFNPNAAPDNCKRIGGNAVHCGFWGDSTGNPTHPFECPVNEHVVKLDFNTDSTGVRALQVFCSDGSFSALVGDRNAGTKYEGPTVDFIPYVFGRSNSRWLLGLQYDRNTTYRGVDSGSRKDGRDRWTGCPLTGIHMQEKTDDGIKGVGSIKLIFECSFSCRSGSFLQNLKYCSHCPVGKYCPNFYEAIDCPEGSTAPPGSTSASACTCPQGMMMDNGTCRGTICPPNSIAGPNNTCVCVDGFVWTNNKACERCGPNSIKIGDKCACKPDYTLAKNGLCVKCSPNAFPDNEGQCLCDKGYLMLSSGLCVKCPGSATLRVDGSCLCPSGRYWVSGETDPANGTCVTCEPGSYCPGDNGKYTCPANSNSVANATGLCGCICNAGWTLVGNQCTCAANFYRSGSSCLRCPDGSQSDPGATSINQCRCAPGVGLYNGRCGRSEGDGNICDEGFRWENGGCVPGYPSGLTSQNAIVIVSSVLGGVAVIAGIAFAVVVARRRSRERGTMSRSRSQTNFLTQSPSQTNLSRSGSATNISGYYPSSAMMSTQSTDPRSSSSRSQSRGIKSAPNQAPSRLHKLI